MSEIKVVIIHPEDVQNAVVRTTSFIAGNPHSFQDFYFTIKQDFQGVMASEDLFFQVLSADSPKINGLVYYNLEALRDDALAFNFFKEDAK